MRRHSLCYGVVALWLLGVTSAGAATVLEEMRQAQRAQAELQARIDRADDEVRERLETLRRLERETRRLETESDRLAPYLARQTERLEQRETALAAQAEIRAALPALQQRLVARLADWVEQDLPFLVEERRARVANLEAALIDLDMPVERRLEQILAAWRTELDYGRDVDAWRGYLEVGEARREVEFLRLGRVGLYYLTPDGREGGVWRADEARWVALDERERREVRQGLRIAREQRAPELLRLPVSRELESGAALRREAQP